MQSRASLEYSLQEETKDRWQAINELRYAVLASWIVTILYLRSNLTLWRETPCLDQAGSEDAIFQIDSQHKSQMATGR